MIINKEVKKGITVYTLSKKIEDSKAHTLLNNYVKPSDIDDIISHSCDIYSEEGKLLMKFRKDVLSEKHTKAFYDNVVNFAHNWSSNRGNTSGAEKGKRNVLDNKHIMTNIFGYFDRWSPRQKFVFNQTNFKPSVEVRQCRFNMENPEKYQKTLPLLKQINRLYKKLVPSFFKRQNKKANETPFRIADTAFTTVTTNINFRTTIHRDKGDDVEGFGNLVVFEKGKYLGGETCMPQYGIGVDVREGDFLLMDVHELHGNLPFKLIGNDSERMSIVCYLRKGVWERTKGKSHAFFKKHNETVKNAIKMNKSNKSITNKRSKSIKTNKTVKNSKKKSR